VRSAAHVAGQSGGSATKSDYFSRLRSASVLPFFYLIRQTINIFSQ
jgi:hypothetical protein